MSSRIVSWVLIANMSWGTLIGPAQATIVDTQTVLAMESRAALIRSIDSKLAREEVRRAMVELGVDPTEARLRVAALSDRELAQLDGRLDNLPAGGLLALIGAVFVVLLLLEHLGAIDVFKKS